MMQANIGDLVHFQSICAACQKLTNSHFVFPIDDRKLLACLPEFLKRTRFTDNNYVYWDQDLSYASTQAMFLKGWVDTFKGLFGRSNSYGFPDTYLIILTQLGVFTAGPNRSIIALPIEQVSDARILNIANSTNIEHFNYLDLTTHSPNLDRLTEHLR